jgi:hypothetical protein
MLASLDSNRFQLVDASSASSGNEKLRFGDDRTWLHPQPPRPRPAATSNSAVQRASRRPSTVGPKYVDAHAMREKLTPGNYDTVQTV